MKKLLIKRQWCKGCRICVEFCPKQVLGLDADDKVYAKDPEKCILCDLCGQRCPDLAIEVRTGAAAEDTGDWITAVEKA